ncbi:MAG: CocE/NonD family hydrolase, partial [Actinomycetota bacterium]
MARRTQVRIEMPDGVELSATLFFPGAGDGPWPALLDALPYRKDDVSSGGGYYAALADGGYVLCWLDVRGTGSSGGIATDEYTSAERDDLVRVIDWLATQPWSLGTVGMFGTSYGGFNSLQVALEQPPALKAIVPIFASDDRYADDVHYYGGALKQLDVVDYPTYMVAMNALPPVPALWGDGWRDEWQRRLEQNEPWFLTWLAHQHRDDYWRYGSAREDIERIRAATMIVGGWADGYTNIALRSLARMQAPTRLLLGPWAHGSPETCRPGPNIDFKAEMLRWFDRWLKGIDNGVDREPPIVVYQQRSTAPDPLRSEVRGDWRFEPTWPPER